MKTPLQIPFRHLFLFLWLSTFSFALAQTPPITGPLPTSIEYLAPQTSDVFLGDLKPSYQKDDVAAMTVNRPMDPSKLVFFSNYQKPSSYVMFHAPALYIFNIPKDAKRFTSVILRARSQEGENSLLGTFGVVALIDGEKVFESPIVKDLNVPLNITIPPGAKNLALYFDPYNDVSFDMIVLALPYFRKQ